MGDQDIDTTSIEWQWGAMWLAGAAATIILGLRIFLGSRPAEAVAIALLAGVIVFALADVPNERRPTRG